MKRSVCLGLLTLALSFGALLIVGCNDEEPVTGLSDKGEIGVYPAPNSYDFPWTLTGPGGFSQDGAGDLVLEDRLEGEYTLTWGNVNGWVTPATNPMVATLQGGRFLQFVATYRPPGTALPGNVQVNPNPDDILPEGAPWTLEVPEGDDIEGNGDQTFEDMPLGDYTVIWGDVDGWETPDPMTLTLEEGSGRLVHGRVHQPGRLGLQLRRYSGRLVQDGVRA